MSTIKIRLDANQVKGTNLKEGAEIIVDLGEDVKLEESVNEKFSDMMDFYNWLEANYPQSVDNVEGASCTATLTPFSDSIAKVEGKFDSNAKQGPYRGLGVIDGDSAIVAELLSIETIELKNEFQLVAHMDKGIVVRFTFDNPIF